MIRKSFADVNDLAGRTDNQAVLEGLRLRLKWHREELQSCILLATAAGNGASLAEHHLLKDDLLQVSYVLDQIADNGDIIAQMMTTGRMNLNGIQSEMAMMGKQLEKLVTHAYRDELTGAHNVASFELRMPGQLAAETPTTMLLLDIDFFKKVNDGYGHDVGDVVLKSTAELLQGYVKDSDIVARVGGEEFAVVLPDTDLESGLLVAERLRAGIAARKAYTSADGREIPGVTISIGAAQYAPGETLTAFRQRADAALYASKGNGRNQVTAAQDAPPVANPTPPLRKGKARVLFNKASGIDQIPDENAEVSRLREQVALHEQKLYVTTLLAIACRNASEFAREYVAEGQSLKVLDVLQKIGEKSSEIKEILKQSDDGIMNADEQILLLRERAVELSRIAFRDKLTGVENRRSFHATMSANLAQASTDGTPISVLLLDIDRFKTVNDQYGHLAGDIVLQRFAREIQRRVKKGDTVARYGGEEFVAALPGADAARAEIAAERLRKAVMKHMVAMPAKNETPALPAVTVSIGVAEYEPGETLDQLLKRADESLYEAKNAGRNRVCVAKRRHAKNRPEHGKGKAWTPPKKTVS